MTTFKGELFRNALKRRMVITPSCFDCKTARSIARVGFEMVHMTGAGTAATLGDSDHCLVTRPKLTDNAG